MVMYKKSIKILLLSVTILGIMLATLLYFSEWIFPEFNGSYNLGNGIYMMEWDGGGKIIVWGTTIRGNTCYGGSYLVPTFQEHYDSLGNIAEYVTDAKSDEKWIIAKTYNIPKQKSLFYIIDKDYKKLTEDIMGDRETDIEIDIDIIHFSDSAEFAKACDSRNIGLKW